MSVQSGNACLQDSVNASCSELNSLGERVIATSLSSHRNLDCIIKEHFWSKDKYLSMNRRERIKKQQSTDTKVWYQYRYVIVGQQFDDYYDENIH